MARESAKTAEGQPIKRRSILNFFLGASVTTLASAVFYPVARFLSPPRIPEAAGSNVVAAKLSEMADKVWKIFPFGQEPGILVEVAKDEYRAFSAVCTHLDCTVQFDEETRRIWCPCHNGFYDLEGRNVAGPPPRPLEPYKVQVVGDDIMVSRG